MKKVDGPFNVKRETTVEIPAKETRGCTIQAKTIFWMILWCAICSIAVKECKRAGIRLEEEKIKLEQMKDGTLVDTTPIVKPDTIKIGKFQQEYLPLLKGYQKQR